MTFSFSLYNLLSILILFLKRQKRAHASLASTLSFTNNYFKIPSLLSHNKETVAQTTIVIVQLFYLTILISPCDALLGIIIHRGLMVSLLIT